MGGMVAITLCCHYAELSLEGGDLGVDVKDPGPHLLLEGAAVLGAVVSL